MTAARSKRRRPDGLRARARRMEGALRTGPAAHLLGGALDLAQALAHYALARIRGRRLR